MKRSARISRSAHDKQSVELIVMSHVIRGELPFDERFERKFREEKA